MQITLNGLVIRENSFGESNKVITVLSDTHGVIQCFAHGAKSLKNKKSAGTSLLCYSEFVLTKTKDSYRVDDASVKEMFFGLRNDIQAMALAQYFCEAFSQVSPIETEAEDFLRLILNSLNFLCTKKRDVYLIKAVTELRLALLCGYMPDLVACSECAAFESNVMFFDFLNGTITCENCCKNKYNSAVVLPPVLAAMRHITYCDFSKLYNFTLTDNLLTDLSRITERYLITQTELNFKTLDFFNSL